MPVYCYTSNYKNNTETYTVEIKPHIMTMLSFPSTWHHNDWYCPHTPCINENKKIFVHKLILLLIMKTTAKMTARLK